jgi:hypothetical protein
MFDNINLLMKKIMPKIEKKRELVRFGGYFRPPTCPNS